MPLFWWIFHVPLKEYLHCGVSVPDSLLVPWFAVTVVLMTKISKQHREKAYQGRVWSKAGTNFQEPHSSEIIQDMLILQQWIVTTNVNFPPRGKLFGDSVLKVFLVLVMQAPPAQCAPELRTPNKKTQVQSKARCLTNTLGTVSHSWQLGDGGEPSPEPSFQVPVKGQLCMQAFLRTAFTDLSVNYFFCTPTWEEIEWTALSTILNLLLKIFPRRKSR